MVAISHNSQPSFIHDVNLCTLQKLYLVKTFLNLTLGLFNLDANN